MESLGNAKMWVYLTWMSIFRHWCCVVVMKQSLDLLLWLLKQYKLIISMFITWFFIADIIMHLVGLSHRMVKYVLHQEVFFFQLSFWKEKYRPITMFFVLKHFSEVYVAVPLVLSVLKLLIQILPFLFYLLFSCQSP